MNGIVQDEPSVSKWWSAKRPRVLYTPIPKLSEDRLSAQEEEETWLKRNLHFQSELMWLLSLEHHRFWSQILYSPHSLDGLVSFLQEALPYYVLPEFLSTPRLEEAYHKTAEQVFQAFIRLSIFDSKFYHYFPVQRQADEVYEHHVFTLPIVLDLCHLFGRENQKAISDLVETLFERQPRYLADILQVVTFFEEALRILTHSFCGATSILSVCGEPAPLSFGNDQTLLEDMTPEQCRDKLLYLLDTVSSGAVFLDIFNSGSSDFRSRHFHNRLAMFYNEAIPRIEKKVEGIGCNEDQLSQYVDLKHKLSLAKMEILRFFKAISLSYVHYILENRESMTEDELKSSVDDYLTMLTDCLSEQIFVRDFNSVYGIDNDLDTIAQISPDLDTIKYNYLMESILSSYSLPKKKDLGAPCFKSSSSRSVAKSLKNMKLDETPSTSSKSSLGTSSKPHGVELDSLVTEVKDILPDLGDGFVKRCLDHFNYQSEAVINALLEDNLPEALRSLDRSAIHIEDVSKEQDSDVPKRYNIFDNDEFDVMSRDHVDTSRVHKGKKRTVPKNAFDLLNDKSDVKGLRDMYQRFGTVDTAGSMYDDEYDDTYDDDLAIAEAGEVEKRRQFVVPRVLRSREEVESSEGSEDEDESTENTQPRDAFCQDPALLRAKRERQRSEQMTQRGGGSAKNGSRGSSTGRGGSSSSGGEKRFDVVGKPKGQGQEKQVLINREKKNTNKSSRANHNRRSGAQHKRNQGMIPS
ncbi:Activating signal cointegrator 1 complex subunit 2 [Frankliniella fusca]|uniref:Activating signal cointegrator 1 complex subunit 2 n=1 Tax=Frankliniella fusca TaxID=407009 RepID=A0AAE1L623_9NEOP|nr:Activating signal cointegrator 1 complex subunit 2 [Frankliniella fusca]